ncbi:MAG TPA: hypothetical protein IAC60_05425 [Candidatus Enterosoma merdigallinarum]|nr:hypothetical protein [Candidatus Enterosoma merdigallinarum]
MPKRRLLLLLSAFFLSSCSMPQDNYRLYYGNMAMPSFSIPYVFVDEKVCQDAFTPPQEEGEEKEATTYYCNIDTLSSQAAVDEFFLQKDLSYNPEDVQQYRILPRNVFYVILFCQIPGGYQAYKRKDIQAVDENGNPIIISDNFYCYRSRPELNYFFIDIKKDPSHPNSSVRSFLFQVDKAYLDTVREETIRPILYDASI